MALGRAHQAPKLAMSSNTKTQKTQKHRKQFVFLFFCFFVFSVMPVFAEKSDLTSQIQGQINAVVGAEPGEATPKDPRLIIAQVVQAMLALMGTIFMVLIIAAGYWRLTSHGEESRIEKSTKTMQGAVIGLAVVLLAYSITLFIAKTVLESATHKKAPPPTPYDGVQTDPTAGTDF